MRRTPHRLITLLAGATLAVAAGPAPAESWSVAAGGRTVELEWEECQSKPFRVDLIQSVRGPTSQPATRVFEVDFASPALLGVRARDVQAGQATLAGDAGPNGITLAVVGTPDRPVAPGEGQASFAVSYLGKERLRAAADDLAVRWRSGDEVVATYTLTVRSTGIAVDVRRGDGAAQPLEVETFPMATNVEMRGRAEIRFVQPDGYRARSVIIYRAAVRSQPLAVATVVRPLQLADIVEARPVAGNERWMQVRAVNDQAVSGYVSSATVLPSARTFVCGGVLSKGGQKSDATAGISG